MPALGDHAPAFALPDQHGATLQLADAVRERSVLLVFFPFAFSRVCTGELDAIAADLSAYQSPEVQVVGISCDPMFTLRAWSEQQRYAFPLLSDFWPHGAAARAYGVLDTNRGMAGRGTFLVDRAGTIRYTAFGAVGAARDLTGALAAVAALADRR